MHTLRRIGVPAYKRLKPHGKTSNYTAFLVFFQSKTGKIGFYGSRRGKGLERVEKVFDAYPFGGFRITW
jgi:hypothetical protein